MGINMSLYEKEIESVERGQTLSFNHEDCPAGQDTKRRLYFTRPASSAGVVVAFCHNCQEHGVVRHDVHKYRQFKTREPVNVSVSEDIKFAVPTGLIQHPKDWPEDALVWRVQKNLTVSMITDARIGYDPTSNRIYLPMYDVTDSDGEPRGDSALLGYQLRQIDGTGPKYYTALRDGNTKPYTILYKGAVQTRVLVEDLASGLVLSRALMGTPNGVVVNYGVKVSPEILYECRNFRQGLVWLDNDGDLIKKQAATIARTWELISGKPVKVEEKLSDPKQYDKDFLRKRIEGIQ